MTDGERFRGRFLDWFNGGCQDVQGYNLLISTSPRIQIDMGGYGVAHSFRPPYSNYMVNSYEIILNAIPQIMHYATDNDFGLFRQTMHKYAQIVDEALLRYIGVLRDSRDASHKELINPIVWLREGVRSFIGTPIALLGWLGIISAEGVARILQWRLLTIFSGFITLVGLVSSIVTIVLGWDDMGVKLTKGAQWMRSLSGKS